MDTGSDGIDLHLLYYRPFLDYRSGVEREVVVARFAQYFAGLDAADTVEQEEDPEPEAAIPEPRILATLFLRKLVSYGWVSEEEQLDFTRVVNLCTHARPFLEALDTIERGASVEYESHIVAVYSSLCGDAAKDNGEHAVLNAHWHTRLLVESLKVLEQNIKSHVQQMFRLDAAIPEILRVNYDVYMHEVVDRACTRRPGPTSRSHPRSARTSGSFSRGAWTR